MTELIDDLIKKYEKELEELKELRKKVGIAVTTTTTTTSDSNNNITEQSILRPYQTKLEVSQSAKGIFQITGVVHFDGTDKKIMDEHRTKLLELIEDTEKDLEKKGARIAKNVKLKPEDYGTT